VLSLAAASDHLSVFVAALIAGAVIGALGHLVRSRALILAGIVVIAAVSAYFSFVLQPNP
jgi:uncharacterized membrane protein YedE/YeeE